MKKSVKISLLIACVFIVLGAAIFADAMSSADFNFGTLSTQTYTTNTYKIADDFDKISIEVSETDIEFKLSDNKKCIIECFEKEKNTHEAYVENKTLFITNSQKWYHDIGVVNYTPKLVLYLPKESYESLAINTNTGDINIPNNPAFKDIEINGDTSDISCYASVIDNLNIGISTGDVILENAKMKKAMLSSTTGDITIANTDIENSITITTDTGNVNSLNTTYVDFKVETDTGDLSLTDTVAKNSFSITTNTGDVEFKNSDAEEISILTDTGDICGTLLTEKIFMIESDTGDIDVPKTSTGGVCDITTNTGDVTISITKNSTQI